MRDREKVGEPPFFFMYGTGRGEGPSLLDCLSQNFAGRRDQEVICVIKVALCDDEPAMCRDLKERVFRGGAARFKEGNGRGFFFPQSFTKI